MTWLCRVSVLVLAIAPLEGCSLVVDFDRSLLEDAGAEASPDAASDASPDLDPDESGAGGADTAAD